MAKHNNTSIYPFDDNVTLDDGLLGFDAENVKRTKNFKLSAIATLIAQQIGPALSNSLISGQVIWIEGLTYKFVNISYWINVEFIEIESQELTLSAADPDNPRIDAIYADAEGVIHALEGQPAVNPARPILNLKTQVKVTFILIPAASTEPSGVSEDIVYSDNLVTDWTNSTSGFSTVDFDSLTNPFDGTKCIAIKEASTSNSVLRFYKGVSTVDYNPSLKLHLYIKVDALVNNSERIDIQLFNDNVPEQSTFATLGNGDYGFDFSYMDGYQSIIIPFSDMTGIQAYNGINMYIGEALEAAFKVDQIRIVSGVDDLVLNDTYLSLTDTLDDTYTGKENYRPTVKNGVLELIKVEKLRKQTFTATAGQTEFSITDNPNDIFQVFEGHNLYLNWTYVGGVLTTGDAMLIGTILTVNYYH